jgi:hypothetical protein
MLRDVPHPQCLIVSYRGHDSIDRMNSDMDLLEVRVNMQGAMRREESIPLEIEVGHGTS